MKLRHIFYLLITLPLLWSCNNEDDINEIFVSGTWNVGNFYTGGKWHKVNDGAIAKYRTEEDFKALDPKAIESIFVIKKKESLAEMGYGDYDGALVLETK